MRRRPRLHYMLAGLFCVGCQAKEARQQADETEHQQADETELVQIETALRHHWEQQKARAASPAPDADATSADPLQDSLAEEPALNGGEQNIRPSQAAFPSSPTSSHRDLAAVIDGNNRFALDLYHQLRTREGNLFFSPASVSTALAMTYAGAAGATETEMAKTLHFALPDPELHEAMHTLQKFWRSQAKEKGIQIKMANRLWGQQNATFLEDFLSLTRDKYGAELAQLDFNQTEGARQMINDWVEDQTENKIVDLIPPRAITPETQLVLTNAVYFHGTWSDPFNKDRTKNQDFHLASSETIQIPMMYRQGTFRYGEVDDLQILELPYGDGSLSMVVLLPRASDGIAQLEDELTLEKLKQWTESLHREDDVQVYLPKFKTESRFNLSDTLEAMGMASAFDPDTADFSGMTGNRDVFISSVIHQAFVDVNEQGTEAAAATGVVMGVTSAAPDPKPPIVFRADHPFVFMIRDNRIQTMLFVGRITDPSS